MELPEAEAFIDPVPEDVPGYYAATRHPMDLGTGEGGGGGGGGRWLRFYNSNACYYLTVYN